jgi:EamA domain-containing membrane protein RarD
MIEAAIFVNPVTLDGGMWTLLLVLPLCASVSVIYKTVRTNDVRRLPLQAVGVMAYISAGLVALAGLLYLAYSLLA